MKLSKFLKAANYKICGGSSYLWNCYPDAYTIDICDASDTEFGSCTFNTKTQKVYEITLHNYHFDEIDEEWISAYRWINPKFKDLYISECNKRNVSFFTAWDNVQWMDYDKDEILVMVKNLSQYDA